MAADKKTWLRQWREREGFTQDDCASAFGISRNRWSEIENDDDSPPSFQLALDIEARTGIRSSDFFRTDKLRAKRR